MADATLLVIQGPDQGSRFQLDDESVGLGRGVHNGIRIFDTEVSRQHATLAFTGGRYVITDLNSSNGTFVNGARVRSRELKSGDQIQLGRTILAFNVPAEEGDSQYVAARNIDLVGRRDAAADSAEIVNEFSQTVLEPGAPPDQQTLANLQALYRISEEAVRPSLPIDQLLKRILDLTIEVVGADRGCMLLSDQEKDDVVPQVFSHRRGADSPERMPVSRSIVDYVVQEGHGVRTSDARRDRRFEPGQSILQAGIREAMCVPMQGRHELMGVIYVDTTTAPERVLLAEEPGQFSEEQLRLLVAIGRQAALAIEDDRYQQALVKAERLAAIGQTIAMLSHHIKNILQGVRGGSYLIDMGLKNHDEELIHKGWDIVEKNQGKIYHLVLDMLTFSKERQPALQTAGLNETVGEVCELMQARAEESGVAFTSELSPDVPETPFDPEGIHRAVLNIVTNAVDAAAEVENGSVRVQTGYERESDVNYVVVADNGPGIPEDQLPRIFNVFESTKGARGTGLGLAVSQKIIREHGGDITVESKPGEGCRFVLAWPSIDEEQRSAGGQTMS